MDLTLETAQLAVATEECRVGTTLFMRAVVAGEHHERVLVKPLFPEQLKYVANVGIKASDHGRELGMGVGVGVVARPWSPPHVLSSVNFSL